MSFRWFAPILSAAIIAATPASATSLDGGFEKLKTEALAGDAKATFLLGQMFLNGSGGVTKNINTGLDLDFLGAYRGDPEAEHDIGGLYQVGGDLLGVNNIKKDGVAAMHWYMRAVHHGYALSANKIAEIYSQGQFAEQDPVKSMIYLTVAYRLLTEHPELQLMYGKRLTDDRIAVYKSAVKGDMDKMAEYIKQTYQGDQGIYVNKIIDAGVKSTLSDVVSPGSR